MPIYEYACGRCDHEFEVDQRITDEPVRTCPECRSRKVKRLISQTSFVLRGGGWYADAYASSNDKPAFCSERVSMPRRNGALVPVSGSTTRVFAIKRSTGGPWRAV